MKKIIKFVLIFLAGALTVTAIAILVRMIIIDRTEYYVLIEPPPPTSDLDPEVTPGLPEPSPVYDPDSPFNKYGFPRTIFETNPNVEAVPYVNYSQSELDDVGYLNLTSTYDCNSLKVERVNIGGARYTEDSAMPKIDGLSNEQVEAVINNKIAETYQMIDETSATYVDYNVAGNFANILSLYIYYSSDLDYQGEDFVQSMAYLNFDLNTGREICFNELFTPDADLNEIVRKSVYAKLIAQFYWTNEEYNNSIFGYDEELAYKTVNQIINGNKVSFFVTTNYIAASVDIPGEDYSINVYINLVENSDSIALYNRFSYSGYIYDNQYDEDNLKNLFVCSNRNSFAGSYGFITDNVFLDFIIEDNVDYFDTDLNSHIAEYEEIVNAYVSKMQDMILSVEEEAAENPDLIYVIMSKVSATNITSFYYDQEKSEYEYVTTNSAVVNEIFNVYTMSKDYFDEYFIYNLSDAYRNNYYEYNDYMYVLYEYDMYEDDMIPLYDDNILFTSYINTSLVNFVTGNTMTTLEDIYIDSEIGYDSAALELYNYFICNAVLDKDYAECLDIIKNSTYKLKRYCISFDVEGYEDAIVNIYYTSINSSRSHLCDE